MERDSLSQKFPIGSSLPEFALPNVDGRMLGTAYLGEGKASLVVFSCNHCPYVKGSEDMLVEVIKRFDGQGLRTVAISSNDAVKYPEDNFDKMKEKATVMDLPYPYLYDESQDVARLFDAACTPEMYLFDGGRTLVYHGTINDSPRDRSKVTKEYLSSAITAVLAGTRPETPFVHPIGCSIKWK